MDHLPLDDQQNTDDTSIDHTESFDFSDRPFENDQIEDLAEVTDLAAIIKQKPSRAVRDGFYEGLFQLSEIEALKKVVDLLQVVTKEPGFETQAIEAWDYLTARKLWTGLDSVFDYEAMDIFGMPNARQRAKKKIFGTWGLPAKLCLSEKIRPPLHSSVLLCTLEELSARYSLELANSLLNEVIHTRKVLSATARTLGIEADEQSALEAEEWSTDSDTTDNEFFKDEQWRRYTCGDNGSDQPYVLIWDILDILDSPVDSDSDLGPRHAQSISSAALIVHKISEGVALLSEGIILHSHWHPEDSIVASSSEEESSIQHELEFPCLCAEDGYDNVGFDGYPSRMGWTVRNGAKTDLKRTDGSKFSIDEAGSFLQAWLFFGTLIEVFRSFGVTVRPSDFIRSDGQERLITFIFLDSYLEAWADSMDANGQQAKSEHFKKATDILSVVDSFATGRIQINVPDDILRPVIQLSVILENVYVETQRATLAGDQVQARSFPGSLTKTEAALQYALQTWLAEIPSTEIPPGVVDGEHGDNWYIIEYGKMIKAGWCPKEINKLVNDPIIANSWYYYYASTLNRRVVGRDHKDCSKDACRIQKVDETTYKTKHYGDCEECRHIPIDSNDVIVSLKREKVTRVLISMTHMGDAEDISAVHVTLAVVDSGPYVAISHVWSDGLGNADANALPLCQIIRLRSQAAALFRQNSTGLSNSASYDKPAMDTSETAVAVWIDTLCVPLEREARKLALAQLGKAYKEADHVLVLDEELQRGTIHCREEERLMRILLCGWMQRLWTLEEAALGRDRLRFQFLEEAISLPHDLQKQGRLFLEPVQPQGPILYRNISMVVMDRLPFPHKFEVAEADSRKSPLKLPLTIYDGPSPLFLLEGLQLRTTTKIEDEFLCVASLMNLDMKPVAHQSSAPERAKALFLMLADCQIPVPASILFSREPKLQLDGLRWAPSSLITLSQHDPHPLLAKDIIGWHFGSHGLRCRYPAYALHTIAESFPKCKYVATDYAGYRELWEPAHYAWDELSTSILVNWKRGPGSDCNNRLAFVLDRLNDGSESSARFQNASQHQAVLAYIYHIEQAYGQEILYARYITPLRKVSAPAEDESGENMMDLGESMASQNVADAKVIYMKHTEWCIG